MIKSSNNIDDIFKNSFKDYTVEPSNNLWSKINRKLWLKEFIKFNPTKFNIYYVTLIITIIGFSFTYTNNNKKLIIKNISKNETLNFDTRKILKTNPTDKIIYSNNINNNKNPITNNNTEPLIDLKENIIIDKNEPEIKEIEIVDETISIPEAKKITKAEFTVDKKYGCAPLTVQFTNYSQNFNEIIWNMGDGNNITSKEPVYVYSQAGIYPVKLIAKGNNKAEFIDTIVVYNKPTIANHKLKTIKALENEYIQFNPILNNNTYCKWDFGDGYASEKEKPYHAYKKQGNYKVKLKVWSGAYCMDSTIYDVIIEESEYKIEFPNAFSPNTNGGNNGSYNPQNKTNDVFYPIITGDIDTYTLQIYNRTGKLLYTSHSVNKGWDGYYNNELVQMGVYLFEAKGVFANGKPFVKQGNITVVHKK